MNLTLRVLAKMFPSVANLVAEVEALGNRLHRAKEYARVQDMYASELINSLLENLSDLHLSRDTLYEIVTEIALECSDREKLCETRETVCLTGLVATQKQNAELIVRLDQADNTAIDLATKHANALTELNNLQREYETTKAQLNTTKVQLNNCCTNYEQQSREYNALHARHSELVKREEYLTKRVEELRADRNTLSEKLSNVNTNYVQDLKTFEAKLRDKDQEAERLRDNSKRLIAERDEAKKKLEDKIGELQDLRNASSGLNERYLKTVSELEQAKADRDVYAGRWERLERSSIDGNKQYQAVCNLLEVERKEHKQVEQRLQNALEDGNKLALVNTSLRDELKRTQQQRNDEMLTNTVLSEALKEAKAVVASAERAVKEAVDDYNNLLREFNAALVKVCWSYEESKKLLQTTYGHKVYVPASAEFQNKLNVVKVDVEETKEGGEDVRAN